jgi:hypothetical protein
VEADDCVRVLWHMQEQRVAEEEGVEGKGDGGAEADFGRKYQYRLQRFQEGGGSEEEELPCWKDVFRNVWEMRCAMPPMPSVTPKGEEAHMATGVLVQDVALDGLLVSGKKRKSVVSTS